MLELLEDAGEELKRADHLIYVSLKYTRTADVLMNCLTRMIDAYTYLIDALLEYAKDTKNLQDLPKTPLEKGNLAKELYPQQEVQDNVELFFLLRKIYRAPHETQEEYRRHVAIITILDGREEMVNIDIVTQYYEFETNFFKFVVNMLKDHAKKKHEEENDWEL
jgi:hypothetical protein